MGSAVVAGAVCVAGAPWVGPAPCVGVAPCVPLCAGTGAAGPFGCAWLRGVLERGDVTADPRAADAPAADAIAPAVAPRTPLERDAPPAGVPLSRFAAAGTLKVGNTSDGASSAGSDLAWDAVKALTSGSR